MNNGAPRVDIRTQQNRTFEIVIEVTVNDANYILQVGEQLIFGVKLNHESTSYDIQKILTSADRYNDGYLLSLTAEEMNIPNQHYHYDVALQTTDGKLYPVIEYSDFWVTESVVDSIE